MIDLLLIFGVKVKFVDKIKYVAFFLFQMALIFKKSNEFKDCSQTTFEFLNIICLVKATLLRIGKPGTKIFDQFP